MIHLPTATQQELTGYITACFTGQPEELFTKARQVRETCFGRRVFVRGLIEVSNRCPNNCYYCGIRAGNHSVARYRLSETEILTCCETGYCLGIRTFVLQGGEDPWFTDERLCALISQIRARFPETAVTLSLGERREESYRHLFEAGADRYLLRHETADAAHYQKLHPAPLTLANRKRCLQSLQRIGFQTGAGFMVGSPFQTAETLAQDLLFLRTFKPQMVGIGPFIPHKDTPLAGYPAGGLHETLVMLALTRVLLPNVLLPATTALGSIVSDGRERGLAAGANVVMPNLSPPAHRKKYSLYNGKNSTGAEAAEGMKLLSERLGRAGFVLDLSRGDYEAKKEGETID